MFRSHWQAFSSMCVRYGFMIETCKFTHSLLFWHVLLMMQLCAMHDGGRRQVNARMSPEIWKMVNSQQKDERRQDNGDRRRLACQHPGDLLCSLTCEWDRQRTARCHLDCTSSFTISNFPRASREAHDAHAYT